MEHGTWNRQPSLFTTQLQAASGNRVVSMGHNYVDCDACSTALRTLLVHDSIQGPRYHRLELVPTPWLRFATGHDVFVSFPLPASRRFVFFGIITGFYCMHVPSLPSSRLLPDYRDAVSLSHLDLHVTGKICPSPPTSRFKQLDLEIHALTSVVGPERSTTRTARLSSLVQTQCPSSTATVTA
ncbi:hypothetical protein CC77DRAFT_188146 [Alternaria alternata]|uniref:Uncharacterized protein n=1 Tax=Alternaria alternata TaxID=5599 RepID=A0A177DIX8_ALTAL|nr:hypothetical protein CC77DRAFT_188146 [Alternaria alternata]OAG19151.1 hypothetical protein CC77DRAFT_188146 [Alternaria alternata]